MTTATLCRDEDAHILDDCQKVLFSKRACVCVCDCATAANNLRSRPLGGEGYSVAWIVLKRIFFFLRTFVVVMLMARSLPPLPHDEGWLFPYIKRKGVARE